MIKSLITTINQMENLPSACRCLSFVEFDGNIFVQKIVTAISSCSLTKMPQTIISPLISRRQMPKLTNGSLLLMRRVKYLNERVSAK